MVIDGRGNICLNGFGGGWSDGGQPDPGIIALVTPDGRARQVAGEIEFPNAARWQTTALFGLRCTPKDEAHGFSTCASGAG